MHCVLIYEGSTHVGAAYTMFIIDARKIHSMLLKSGIEKVYVMEEKTACILTLAIYEGDKYLILITKGKYSWYSKIVPAERVLETYWRCNYLTYFPEGLYTFSDSINGLIEGIVKVLKKYQNSKIKR